MLTVKCGRNEYDLDATDEIKFNGACYQLITKKQWNESAPILAKAKAEKLIKSGDLVFSREENSLGVNLKIYKPKSE
ncbi:hypothetical protein JOD82_001893 [Paenibacillus sp. 1182]|uniref:hypothetical protein n=1 Tax=Paenibacillus sp. 1182 TaxID=2806565 RepID=UPI001AE8DF82|nr:hypothetical protein [Paenibacillus sp. 1182]MBP1308873.1 hypothetical protein [Paenibacillus sp. 1182]